MSSHRRQHDNIQDEKKTKKKKSRNWSLSFNVTRFLF